MSTHKISLVLPTLNEIDGMKAIMPRIKKEWYDELVIIDGGSTDGTCEYAKEHGYFLKRQKGKGIRTALDQAFFLTTGDIIITFTPDGNSVPEEIPALIEKMKEGFDMVIVSRYLDGARSHDDSIVSGLGNRAFTFLINLLHHGRYTDSLVAFRAFRRKAIENIGLANGPTNWFEKRCFHNTSWDFLSSVRCARKKLKVGEIAGNEPARIGGEAKVHKVKMGLVFLVQLFLEIFIEPKQAPLENY